MTTHNRRYYIQILLVFVGIQVLFWFNTNDIRPRMTVVPNVPGEEAISVLSFGDKQALFRLMAFQLGNAGDSFGRSTALKKYDLNKVKLWFFLLDKLDRESNLLPSMAAYYFAQTQNKPDARHMVEYLYEHAKDRPEKKWWWLTQASYIALYKVGDSELALKIAGMLRDVEGIPLWARQLSAFVYEGRGEFDAALKIMETILENTDDIPQHELNFMQHFVEERINRLDSLSKKARKRLGIRGLQ